METYSTSRQYPWKMPQSSSLAYAQIEIIPSPSPVSGNTKTTLQNPAPKSWLFGQSAARSDRSPAYCYLGLTIVPSPSVWCSCKPLASYEVSLPEGYLLPSWCFDPIHLARLLFTAFAVALYPRHAAWYYLCSPRYLICGWVTVPFPVQKKSAFLTLFKFVLVFDFQPRVASFGPPLSGLVSHSVVSSSISEGHSRTC